MSNVESHNPRFSTRFDIDVTRGIDTKLAATQPGSVSSPAKTVTERGGVPSTLNDYSEANDKHENQVSLTADAKWERNFQKIVSYREKNGHTLVPNRYPLDPQLASWVTHIRRLYKNRQSGVASSSLTADRIKRLEEIDFRWSTADPRHVPWDSRYIELQQFVIRFGHAQVPIGWKENVKLSNWVSTQRQEYKLMLKGRATRLTPDRIEKLNRIKFIWEAQRGGPRRSKRAIESVPPSSVPVKEVWTSLQIPKQRVIVAPGWAGSVGNEKCRGWIPLSMPRMIPQAAEVSDVQESQSSMKISDWCSCQLTTVANGSMDAAFDNATPNANLLSATESDLAATVNCSIDGGAYGTADWHSSPNVFHHVGAIINVFPIARPFQHQHSAHQAILRPHSTSPLLEGSNTG